MQIDIVKGVYVDGNDYREKYPINYMPVALSSGLSNGYLKPIEGIVEFSDLSTFGKDRGGINYRGNMYRAIGAFLVSVDANGVVAKIGEITNDNQNVSFAYSFDRLAVVSNGNLYYYIDATKTFTQVTDPDLGVVNQVIWVDGYFALTDDEFIIVTELNDPTDIDPFKYGSSEADPDPIIGLLKLRNEIVALNRYTIEFFANTGSTGFPFQRIQGAQIMRGVIGKDACCVYDDTIAFMGGGLNEEIAIYQGANGQSQRISSKEIDIIIGEYTEQELALTKMEMRAVDGELLLYVHLLRETYIYNMTASRVIQKPLWFRGDSFISGDSYYDAWNFTNVYDKWICGSRSGKKLGQVTQETNTHWGNKVNWEIQTAVVFNEGKGALVYEMELQGNIKSLPLIGKNYIKTQYSIDGVTFSQPVPINTGRQGNRRKRMRWFRCGMLKNTRIQKFTGDSDSNVSFTRLDMKIEGLQW